MKFPKIKIFFILLAMVFIAIHVNAKEDENNKKTKKILSKISGSPSRTHFNINNISTWIYNNGNSNLSPAEQSGFVFPKGSNKTAVYQSGFVWGANVGDEKRVGGSTYSQGLTPGAIVDASGKPTTVGGVAEDPGESHVRIYRVRTDWESGSMRSEILDGEGSEAEIRAQYEKDWNEWPAEFGAPYEDIDSNGVYNPTIDVPGFPGATQTIWFVANDLDPKITQGLYGSTPMGIEMQATIWGYALGGAIGNIMFRKYTIINKSENSFDSMYVSMWSDPDVGDATDDFSGCDIDRSLMFTYNGVANDATYGANPPAVGFDFFQGPMISGEATDTAIFNNKYKLGYKNLPMSAHYFFINQDQVYSDPELGQYIGTLQFHNLFRGRITESGDPFADPTTNQETKFTLSGDPIAGTGWIDGIIHSPGDRRQGMVAGPFTMASGDTQEVVVAEIAAGGITGIGALDAVTFLKIYDDIAQSAYDNFFVLPSPPPPPVVSATSYDNEIALNWGEDQERIYETEDEYVVEGLAGKGKFYFQGYNVYQLPSRSATKADSKRIATFDIIDGVKTILDQEVDPESGATLMLPQQYGGDYGISRSFRISKDYLTNKQLENGTPYYFAVTAYSYNNNILSVPNTLENPFIILEVIPENDNPGYVMDADFDQGLDVEHTTGTADATIHVDVVDPKHVTGDKYQVFFDQQHYYYDKDGKWKKTNYPDSVGKAMAKPGDVSPSTLTGVAIYAPNNTFDIRLTLNLVSPTNAWVDGIKLTFSNGITINSSDQAGNNHSKTPVIDGQTITWGAQDTTKDGGFSGGEVLNVNINSTALPISVAYEIYDDGYNDPPTLINAVGNAEISEVGYDFKTEQHWNVKNLTTGNIIIEDQRILNGTNIYTDVTVGNGYGAQFDGLFLRIDGSYKAPTSISGYNVNDTAWNPSSSDTREFSIADYGIHGWTASGKSIDAFGNGVNTIDLLQKDYELKFTGELDSVVINDQTVYITKDGTGSKATLYGARGYDIADHPLNPNPGTNAPFLIDIPFEVWNIDDDQQVNLLVYHRIGAPGGAGAFEVWNTDGRMYCEINNTPYDPNTVNSADKTNTDTDNLTWNLVFWKSHWAKGDVVKLKYPNPFQLGKDTFEFAAPKYTYNATKAADDVEKINVFPNPYYGVNPNEINKYQRFVTFNHLPPRATIRIFNLGGQLVKTIKKNDDTQFSKWDLANENSLPVASGMYIVYIDMPDLGKTKILKVAIIQETQILDRF